MDTKHAKLIHILALVGGILDLFLPLLWSLWFPLLAWLMGPKTPFNDWHGREAVRFQLFMALYSVLSLVVVIILAVAGAGGVYEALDASSDGFIAGISAMMSAGSAGFLIAVAFLAPVVLTYVMPVRAALRARDGVYYVYPFTFSPRRAAARHLSSSTV
jgi:uncharacterized Tic20 family protein